MLNSGEGNSPGSLQIFKFPEGCWRVLHFNSDLNNAARVHVRSVFCLKGWKYSESSTWSAEVTEILGANKFVEKHCLLSYFNLQDDRRTGFDFCRFALCSDLFEEQFLTAATSLTHPPEQKLCDYPINLE